MDLKALYQEVILDHSRHPRNSGSISECTHKAQGFNPLCGDKITLTLTLDGDQVVDAKFGGCGCAISTASSSLMTEMIVGKSRAEVESLINKFIAAVTTDEKSTQALGKLEVLLGVKTFPARVKCATLAWRTLEAALKDSTQPVTTE